MSHHCERCQRSFESDVASATAYRCVACGGRLRADVELTPSEPVADLGGIDFRLWPHLLAVSLAEFACETGTFLKLHRLTAAFEIITRFCTVVVLGNLLDGSAPDGLPESVRKQLLRNLHRPSFGTWREMLDVARKALEERGESATPTPRHVGTCDEAPAHLGIQFDSTGRGRHRSMHDVLAHRGRLTPHEERTYVESHLPAFQEFLLDAKLFSRIRIVGRAQGKRTVVQGTRRRRVEPFPEFDTNLLPPDTPLPRPDQLLLVDGGRAIDLFPLHAYMDVYHYVDKGREETRAAGKKGARDPREFFKRISEASPAVQLYFRRRGKVRTWSTRRSRTMPHTARKDSPHSSVEAGLQPRGMAAPIQRAGGPPRV